MEKAKKQLIIKAILFAISLFLLIWLKPTAGSAYGDEVQMNLIIDKESFSDPDYLELSISMQAPAHSYNAVMGLVNFDPAYLELASTTIDSSFCQLIVPDLPGTEPGKKAIICGNPHNNASTTMPLAALTFKKLGTGWTKITLDGSRMLSGDGLARDLLFDNETHYVNF